MDDNYHSTQMLSDFVFFWNEAQNRIRLNNLLMRIQVMNTVWFYALTERETKWNNNQLRTNLLLPYTHVSYHVYLYLHAK